MGGGLWGDGVILGGGVGRDSRWRLLSEDSEQNAITPCGQTQVACLSLKLLV